MSAVPDSRAAARRFPWLGLIMLSAGVFLSVTGETLPTGLLPDMSASLSVSEPAVGLLVTIFALTVVATSAPLTALTRRMPRHALIVTVIALLGVSYVVSAFAPNYEVIVAIRVVGGIAHGMFWAVVGAYAGHLVPKEQIGRAVSITLGGGTLAAIFGVPLATSFGHAFGWRLAFAALGVLMLIGALAVWRFLPAVRRDEAPHARSIGARQRDATVLPVILVCVLTGLVMIGHFALYTYVAPFLIDAMHVDAAAVGPLLFVYGIAGAAGLVASGSILGRNPQRSLVLALIVTGIAISVLGAFAGTPVVGFVAFTLWGLAFGALPPMLQTRMLHASSVAFRDTASALYTTAFNAGIGGGALVGAIVYGAIGVERLPWIYLGVLVLALALAVVTQAISSRRALRPQGTA
jgi:predicted MFS family arabinose efflux permease